MLMSGQNLGVVKSCFGSCLSKISQVASTKKNDVGDVEMVAVASPDMREEELKSCHGRVVMKSSTKSDSH